MILDHIGVAVRSIGSAVEDWRKLFGYEPLTAVVTNSRQKVRVVFIGKKESLDIKLIEPLDPQSSMAQFVKRGGGLHHFCMRCEDLEKELVRLNELGVRTLVSPQPGEAFSNQPIAFVYAPGGLNIELITTNKRAGRLPRSTHGQEFE